MAPAAEPVPPAQLQPAASLIAAGAPPAAVVTAMSQALAGLAVSTTAIAAAVALAARTGEMLTVGPGTGPATSQVIRAAPAWRAAYIAAAAQRIQTAVRQGATVTDAVRDEARFAEQHTAAQANRVTAAQAADKVATRAGTNLLEWKATLDRRTTADCRTADGRLFDLTRPPVIGLPGAVHPQCFPAGVEISTPGLLATSTRWYSGELVEITTRRGHLLTVTPNHPVLTTQGWVGAGLVDEGSEVVSTRFAEALAATVRPHDHQGPALVEDVTGSFSERDGVLARSVPVTAEDFHGDGAGSQVAVVRADGMLVDNIDPTQPQPSGIQQLQGKRRDIAVPTLGSGTQFLEREPLPTDGGMGRERIARVLLRAASSHHLLVGFGHATTFDPMGGKYPGDEVAADPMLAGERVLAHAGPVGVEDVPVGNATGLDAGVFATSPRQVVPRPLVSAGSSFLEACQEGTFGHIELVSDRLVSAVAGLVELDRVVKVRKWAGWRGHVYSVETPMGWLVSGNILTHNCRCRAVPPSQRALWVGRTVDSATADLVSQPQPGRAA